MDGGGGLAGKFAGRNNHNFQLQNTLPKAPQPHHHHQQPWLGTTNGRRHGQEILQNGANSKHCGLKHRHLEGAAR